MESWHKGDFVQYTKLETIPKKEGRRRYRDKPSMPLLGNTKEYLSDQPLILNGKVPVHTSCSNCDSWLEAYAKITNGKFDRIVEPDATREEKELVTIPETAKLLRGEFERRLSHLQESCSHEKARWTRIERTPGPGFRRTLVCQRCDKVLTLVGEARLERSQKNMRGRLKHWKEEEHKADKALAELATKQRHAR